MDFPVGVGAMKSFERGDIGDRLCKVGSHLRTRSVDSFRFFFGGFVYSSNGQRSCLKYLGFLLYICLIFDLDSFALTRDEGVKQLWNSLIYTNIHSLFTITTHEHDCIKHVYYF